MNWGTELPEDDIARVGLLDRTSVPWKDSLAATAENTFIHNPLIETLDTGLLASAKSPLTRSIIGNIGRGFSDMPAELPQTEPADAFQDPKSLNEQYGQTLGLTFDQPTRKGAVSIMVRRKQEEIQRSAYIERGPGGLAYGIASFATQLAVSASDPLNIASAFLPVVGESRAAIWAARYGKTGGRALTGAVEGAVGAAAIEPLNYAASKYLGDDYTMGDSLMNIALGGVLGGGLHAGFGAISDHLSRLAPETREGALRGAVANMAEGRPVDVGHILDADAPPVDRLAPSSDSVAPRPAQPGAMPVRAEGSLDARITAAIQEGTTFRTGEQQAPRYSLVEHQEPVDISNGKKGAPFGFSIMNAEGREIGSVYGNYHPSTKNLHVESISSGLGIASGEPGRFGTAAARQLLGQLRERFPDAVTIGGERISGARGHVDPLKSTGSEVLMKLPAERVRATPAKAAASLDRARTASLDYGKGQEPSTAAIPREASANADRIVREAHGDDIDAEHAKAIAEIDALEKQGALTPAEAEAGRSGAEDIKRANQQSKAAKAAAGCLLLHP